ncbi:MAG: LPS assembly protein LptD [Candidatus Omnitrophica bacterium]|nr:LPS assembly protein LptD [Candidatus Omnitrophota bacterium]
MTLLSKHKNFILLIFILLLIFPVSRGFLTLSFSEETPANTKSPAIPKASFKKVEGPQTVELNADTVEYSATDNNKVNAKGNVVIIYKGATLTCDDLEFYRDTKIAHATGHVRLVSEQGDLSGDKLDFNFETMTGDFYNGNFKAYPYYGKGEKISKVGDNKILVENGSFTTSDYDKPGYCMKSPKVEIYPKDKLIARDVQVLMGHVPVMYFPKFVQSLNQKKSAFTFTPGYYKTWGAFLLTQYRYAFNDNLTTTLHLDLREKKGLAWGVDFNYKTPSWGNGLIKTYYMDERNAFHHFYQKQIPKPIYRERFKIQWRHQWAIDNKTDAIWQYYKISDANLLKDYFKKEYEKDSNPPSYALVTRRFTNSTLSFRIDDRVNRFVSGVVERLPEIRYDLANQKLGDTGFYFKNTTTASNLSIKDSSPTEIRRETKRFDVNQELSYPMKVAFLEFRPFVSTEQTYYSKTQGPDRYSILRNYFQTGASISTKIFKVLDGNNFLGIPVDRMRHIITPSVGYVFAPDPTVPSSTLDIFDDIDSRARSHKINFALENKIQVKQGKTTRDIFRVRSDIDFLLKEDPGKGGFSIINSEMDFNPTDWLTLYSDSTYDTQEEYLTTANVDVAIHDKDKWSFDIGKRFNRAVDDQITTQLAYKINSKWAVSILERVDAASGTMKEHEYIISRDLHSWKMDLRFSERRGEGSEVMIVFQLKAFPDLGFDIGSGFNRRKAGTQSTPSGEIY